VSGGNAVAVSLALLAGIAGSVQIAVMGNLGDRIGTLQALAFATVVQVVITTGALLLMRRSLQGFADAVHQPVWLWIGGAMGAFIVFSITVAGPRIGTAATIGLLIGGQLAMGVLIDRFGLFGLDRIPLHWPRVLGVLLLAAGAALSLRK
jgi:transporter family-2 protein